MSKTKKKIIDINKNEYIDRRISENDIFPKLSISMEIIDSTLLLLNAKEDMVLIHSLKHLMEFVRRNDENIQLLKEKSVLDLLLQREFYRSNTNTLVRRLSLYLACALMENVNCLVDLEFSKLSKIIHLSLSYYLEDEDDFCLEYLSVIINRVLEDPQMVEVVFKDKEFVLKYLFLMNSTTNPDVLWNSLQIMYKMLKVLNEEERQDFISIPSFPLERFFGELNSEFFEIRKSVLKVIETLVTDCSLKNPLNQDSNWKILLEQLTLLFERSFFNDELNLLVEVLAASMNQESQIVLFFELNLFDQILLKINEGNMENYGICKSLWIFVECSKCIRFLPRLVESDITEKLFECLLNGEEFPPAHIWLGLNRLMKSPEACKRIVNSYDNGLLEKLIALLPLKECDVKAREQQAILLQNLLTFAFHVTASSILGLKLTHVLADIFAQDPQDRSIDLILALLNIIETLSANADYRLTICSNNVLIGNIGFLLMNSFANAIVVTNIFLCLCSLVDEEYIHQILIDSYLCSSIKRALESLSNQVKTSATNFIIQTTRFPILVNSYIDSGVLEVLMKHQKFSYCVPTWTPAIESVLSKSPTLKFCIRNHLGFTDITVGHDFRVSKKKFKDYYVFQCILKEEVSPIIPVLVVNFNRLENPKDLVVTVPAYCSENEFQRRDTKDWCYCRSPADEFLPQYLEEIKNMFEFQNLSISSGKFQRHIDFDNFSKKAKIIAKVVAQVLGNNLKNLDLHSSEECSYLDVNCHLKEICQEIHCSMIPLGRVRSGCEFERAILFKALSDQLGLPCTLQRSVDGRILFNELPLPVEMEQDEHCDKKSMEYMPWRMLRPTHIVDLMYNVGELYPLQSRQALQYLRL